MLQFSHINLVNKVVEEMGLGGYTDKGLLAPGAVFPDQILLGLVRLNRVHDDKDFISHLVENGELSFAIGVSSHSATDKPTHGELRDGLLDGYAYKKVDELSALEELARIYSLEEREKRWLGHLAVEYAIEYFTVYQNGKPEEPCLLKGAVKNLPNKLIHQICSYYSANRMEYFINQTEFFRLKWVISKLDFGFFNDVESTRKFFAYTLHNVLRKLGREHKNLMNGSIDKISKYAYILFPNSCVSHMVRSAQNEAGNILLLFDEAKNLIKDSYLDFLKDVKGSIKEAIMPYLESPKWSG